MLDRKIAERLTCHTKSVLLLGARQVGKSTLIRSLQPKLLVNLADEENYLSYAKDPGRLKRELAALGSGGLVMIDEVQRIPSLLNTVQAILDESDRFRFILTGSSARKLKRGGANLLPGRIILEYLDPCSFWELGDHFDLERALRVGTLPGIYLDHDTGDDVLSTYATVYLREEIQAEAVTKNLGAYARFLDVVAEMSGQRVNYSKVANDTAIPKETIRRFFTLLEDTLLAHRIPAYRSKQSKRRISQRDRLVLFDLGVRNALLGVHKHPINPTERGTLFEQWMILQCISYIRIHRTEWTYCAYRTDTGAEVDFIINLGTQFLAIECKSGKHVTESQLAGLRSFEAIAHQPVTKLVVYGGERQQQFSGGELAIPYETFLRDYLPKL